MTQHPALGRWGVSAGALARLRRIAILVFGGMAVVLAPARAADTLLLGAWEGGDRASQARYGRVVITPYLVKWSGSAANKGCQVGYRLLSRLESDRYPDALPDADAAPRTDSGAPRYTVFLLRLKKRACAEGRSAIQFAIPQATPERAELVTYDRAGRPVSWGHLTRPAAW